MGTELRTAMLLCWCVCLLTASVAPVAGADIDHEHPDEIEGDSDIEQVQQWLGGQMGTAHIDCAEGVSIGNVDLCEELESGNYSSLLDRYETIEAETNGGKTAAQFNETRRAQLEFAALRSEFEATRDDYELARAAGNEREARARARELQRLADRIEARGGEVERGFIELDETTSIDFTPATADINETITEVRAVQRTVENETFTETRLTATANATATFGTPALVTGRLRTKNGTNLSDARIVITDGTETFETRTNETGIYRLPYRPVQTERGETNLTVTYQPANDALYLGVDTRLTLTVNGTDTVVEFASTPERLSFGSNASVTGTVLAAGEPVSNIPVTVRIAGEQVATGRTGAAGSFNVSVSVAPTVATGAATLQVEAGEPGTALQPSRRMTAVTVTETAMALDGEATRTDGRLRVTGQLRPVSGTDREIGPRPLQITYGSETRTVTTAADGRFILETAVETPPDTVTVSYTENGTNLATTERELDVVNASTTQDDASTARGVSLRRTLGVVLRANPIQAGVIGVAIVAILGASGVLARRWWRSRESAGATAEAVSTDEMAAEEGSPSMTGEATDATEQLLTTARERLESDPDGAVRMSYAAVRAALPTDETRTHREFSQAYRPTLDDRAADSLNRLTDAFEVAAFAPTPIDDTQATAAVDAATRVLETVSSE